MIEFRPIDPAEWPSAMVLWTTCFGEVGWIFESLNRATSGRLPKHTRVAVSEGRVVSAVDIFLREIRDEQGVPRKVGAIGSVATLPEFRRQGVSGRLLTDAIEVMKSEDCDWSFLFTGTHHHYARYGWETIPLLEHRATLRGERPDFPMGKVEVGEVEEIELRTDLQSDLIKALPDLAEIYEEYNAVRPLSHVRTPLYWEQSITARLAQPGLRLFVTRHAGKINGYLVASFQNATAELEEVGFAHENHDSLGLLFGHFANVAQELGLKELVTAVALDPPVKNALGKIAENPYPVKNTGSMTRPISERFGKNRIESMFAAPGANNYRLDAF